MNPVAHLINRDKKRLNILTCPTHERYQTGFANLDMTFYMYQGQHIKGWSDKYAPIPQNHILLSPGNIPSHVIFDVVFSQNKFGQFGVLQNIAKQLHIPLVSLEHTLPVKEWDQQTKLAMKNMQGDVNVFISDYSVGQWGFKDVKNVEVIHHMVDTDIFNPQEGDRKNECLSVCNDWINRDYFCGFKLWQTATHGLPVKVIGATPGLSEPAPSVESLAQSYRESLIFVNTSLISPIPTALLEAMASGCICISTSNCMIPEIIKDGVNGFLSNDPAVLRKLCIEVLSNPDKYKHIGENARNTIVEHFNKKTFTNKWDELFRRLAK
jgi:hypothetical protein